MSKGNAFCYGIALILALLTFWMWGFNFAADMARYYGMWIFWRSPNDPQTVAIVLTVLYLATIWTSALAYLKPWEWRHVE